MEEDYSCKNGGRGSHGTYADAGEDDARGDGGGGEASGRGSFGVDVDPGEDDAGVNPKQDDVFCSDRGN